MTGCTWRTSSNYGSLDFARAEVATLSEVFDNVLLAGEPADAGLDPDRDPDGGNLIAIASDRALDPDAIAKALETREDRMACGNHDDGGVLGGRRPSAHRRLRTTSTSSSSRTAIPATSAPTSNDGHRPRSRAGPQRPEVTGGDSGRWRDLLRRLAAALPGPRVYSWTGAPLT